MRTFIFISLLLGLLLPSSPSAASELICLTPVDNVLSFLKDKDPGMMWVGELKKEEAIKFFDMTKDETSPKIAVDRILMFQLSTGNDIVLVINEGCVLAHVIVKPNGQDI